VRLCTPFILLGPHWPGARLPSGAHGHEKAALTPHRVKHALLTRVLCIVQFIHDLCDHLHGFSVFVYLELYELVIANGAVVQAGYAMYILVALRTLNQTHKRVVPESILVFTRPGDSLVQGLALDLHPDLVVLETFTVLELSSYTLSALPAALITP
jgi:hypothetical protein